MSKGVIYILTNPSFPDYIKIGYAKNLERRLQQLNRSETIPFAFRAYAIYEGKINLKEFSQEIKFLFASYLGMIKRTKIK